MKEVHIHNVTAIEVPLEPGLDYRIIVNDGTGGGVWVPSCGKWRPLNTHAGATSRTLYTREYQLTRSVMFTLYSNQAEALRITY